MNRKLLPHVEKVIEDAKRLKKTTIDQLNYIFDTLDGVCIKPAEELTIKEMVAYADFFGLTCKLEIKDKPRRRRTQTI
jgi:hypothetical protein